MSGEQEAQPLRRNRDFVLVLAGQLTSGVGSGLLRLAVLLHVFASTHSTAATTVTFIAETAPVAFLSPWSGALADRVNRRVLLIGSDVLRALILLPLLLSSSLPVLIVVLAVQSAVGTVFGPAYAAFLPSVVPAEQLAAANGLTSTLGSVLALLAPAGGAALFAAYGFGLIVVIDSATFLVSVLTLALIRARSHPLPARPRAKLRVDLAVAWEAILDAPVLRLLSAVIVCFALMEGLISPLFVPFFQGTLHATATQVGFTASAQAFGTIAAGVVVVAVARRLGPTRMFVYGAFGAAVMIVWLGLSATYAMAVVAFALSGVPAMFTQVGASTLLQTEAPDEVLGRINGGFTAVMSMISLAAAAVAAVAAPVVGVRLVVVLGGAAGLVGGVVALSGYRQLRRLDAAAAATLEAVA